MSAVAVTEAVTTTPDTGQVVGLPSFEAMVAVVTHDLRNPLNALSGWLQIMAMDEARLSAPMRRAVLGAQAAVAQQTAQVACLTRVLRAYGGPGQSIRHPIDLEPLLGRVAARWHERFGAPMPSVAEPLSGRRPLTRVWGDAAALEQALVTLGSYALMQAPAAARLRVHLAATAPPCVQLRIDANARGSSAWAVLQGPGERLSLELLEALGIVQAMGAQIRLCPAEQGFEALNIEWVGGGGASPTRND